MNHASLERQTLSQQHVAALAVGFCSEKEAHNVLPLPAVLRVYDQNMLPAAFFVETLPLYRACTVHSPLPKLSNDTTSIISQPLLAAKLHIRSSLPYTAHKRYDTAKYQMLPAVNQSSKQGLQQTLHSILPRCRVYLSSLATADLRRRHSATQRVAPSPSRLPQHPETPTFLLY